MAANKLANEYQKMIGADLYRRTPKAVLAAIVASLYSCGGDNPEDVKWALLNEWEILHANGIVPQVPPRMGQVAS